MQIHNTILIFFFHLVSNLKHSRLDSLPKFIINIKVMKIEVTTLDGLVLYGYRDKRYLYSPPGRNYDEGLACPERGSARRPFR